MTSLTVTAIGMTTSLGLGSVDTCAAARAGLVRLTEIDTVNATIDPKFAKEGLDGVPPFVGHIAPVVGGGCSGLAKLLALSKPALAELLRRAAIPRHELARTGLCINISDAYFQNNFGEAPEGLDEKTPPTYAEQWARVVAAFPERLCAALDLPVPRHALAAFAGRVGLIDLLRHASELMQGGRIDRCIVGGVESCVEPAALHSYAAAGVLKSASNPVGFLPGEAAAYFVAEPETAPAEDRLGVRIAATSLASDVPMLDADTVPCGRGIAEAIVGAIRQHAGPSAFPELIIADLNGTESRAADWGHALVQLRSTFGERTFHVWVPAQSFGETGAASGAIAVCLLYRATERGYVPGSSALVTLASEDGRRGALLLETGRPSSV